MSIRRSLSLLILISAASAVAVIAAFGNGSASAGAEARAKGAVAVPASAIAYASINADRQGAAWQALEQLAGRVPGGAQAVKQLNAKLADGPQQGGVITALGGDISVGLLGVELAGGGQPTADAVLVATAADGPALTKGLEGMGFVAAPALDGQPTWEQGAYSATIDGATAIVATSRATLRSAIEAQNGSAASLADDASFKTTLSRLPDDPLAVAYISPARLTGLAQAAAALLPAGKTAGGKAGDRPDPTQMIATLVKQLAGIHGLGLAVRAEDGGLRLAAAGDVDQATLDAIGAAQPKAYAPTLAERVPANALGFAAVRDLGPALLAVLDQAVQQSPQLNDQIASLEAATGLSLRNDLVPALTGEHALVLLAGSQPSGALMLAPADAAKAASALATAKRFGQTLVADQQPQAGKALAQLAITMQSGGSVVAVGNAPELAAAPAAPITAASSYRSAIARAGVPGTVTAFGYVDVAALLAQARSQGGDRAGMKGAAVLSAVRSIVAWGTTSGASAFVAIG